MNSKRFVTMILYMAIGAVLWISGVASDTWQFWTIMGMVVAIDCVSFDNGRKTK